MRFWGASILLLSACSAGVTAPLAGDRRRDGGVVEGGPSDSLPSGADAAADAGAAIDADASPIADAFVLHQSGSRLRAVFVEAMDGRSTPLLERWHDLHIGQDCAPRLAADGSVRCLPLDWDGTRSRWELHYRDASCSGPLIAYLPPVRGMPPRYVTRWYFADRCIEDANDPAGALFGLGAFHRAFELGAQIPDPGVYDLTVSGDCVYLGLQSDYVAYDVGPEVPPDRFARASVSIGDRGRVAAQAFLRYEDGAFELAGTIDPARNVWCESRMIEGASRCGPLATSGDDLYGDAQCSQRVLLPEVRDFREECRPAWVVENAEICGSNGVVASLGAERWQLYTSEPMCQAQPCEACPAYERGATIAANRLEALSPMLFGEGTLKIQLAAGENGVPLRASWPSMFDVARNAPCWSIVFDDGTTRCVPLPAFAGGAFADPACAQPLIEDVSGCERNAPPPATVLTLAPLQPFAFVVSTNDVRAVGAEHFGDVYRDCFGDGGGARRPGARYFQIGPQIDARSFPEMRERRE